MAVATHLAFFGNVVGADEVFLILVIALLLFGADRLPGIARSIGRALAELRRASESIRDEVMNQEEPPPRRPAAPAPQPPKPSPTTASEPPSDAARKENPTDDDKTDHPHEFAG